MATASPKPDPMPDASVPLVLPDGKMHPDWYRWLKKFFDIFKDVRGEIP